MFELAADLLHRVEGRTAFVTATVTTVNGSAPRQPGASLVVDADGAVLGNVSGGCVDSAVHQACEEMLAGDTRPRVVRFEDRLARLRAAGLTDRELGRLHSPIGLDLGARTAQETALSIAAEIVAVRYGGAGVPLRTGAAIHHGDPFMAGLRTGLDLDNGTGIARALR